ncbi:MAG: hypothetical protein ACXV8I_11540 [Methylobacter sp.]
MTPIELTAQVALTEQAFALYRRLLNVEGMSDFSSQKAKRLRTLADKAFDRYTRRKMAYERSISF